MKKEKGQYQGYITVMAALVLVLGISLCLTLIEGSRRNTAILVAECAADTGLNSILAEYHKELFKQYGVFFIDTSYGTTQPSHRNVLNHLKEYVEVNLSQQSKFMNLITEDFIDLHWDEGEILEMSVSSDEGGKVLRRQITEYMEERWGISYGKDLLEWANIIEEHNLRGDWYSRAEEETQRQLKEWTEGMEEENEEGLIESVIYYSGLLETMQERTLQLLYGVKDLSQAAIDSGIYLSQRERLSGTGLNSALLFSDNDWDSILLEEYILEKTGHYGMEKENGLLKYQTEYILYGGSSDRENLSKTTDSLLSFRAMANSVHILSCQEKMDFLKQIADALAEGIGVPESSLLFQILFVLIWAEFEALWDVGQLLEGEEIPLIKNTGQWHYSLGIAVQGEEEETAKENILLGYEDYLRIFLMFQEKESLTYRLMDIMEMDIRLTPGNENFRMDGCIDSVTVCFDLESGYGYQFFLTRNYGY